MLRAFVLAILCCVHVASGAGTNSLRYFYTGTSGMTEFPEFVVVGMVDDVQIDYYDSKSKQNVPRQQWMKDNMEPGYWETQTQICLGAEQIFKWNIGIAMQRFNQTGGVHSWQHMYGCELDDDGTKRGFDQYGYDGNDFIIFDKDTRTWTAASQRAFTTKLKWEANRAMNQHWKGYLETECIEWLQKYVQYGRGTLERRVPPAVTLLQRKARGSADTEVLCHVTGFFPRAVAVTWVRDGRDHLEEGVQSGEVLPNQDGTYQLRKILTVSPEEQRRHSYSCQVDHVSFTERQNYIWDPNMRSNSDGNEGDDELERGEREGGILTVNSEEQRGHSYSCQVKHISFTERQNYIWDPNMRSNSEDNEGDDELERGEREGGILTVNSEEQRGHSYSCQVKHISFTERQNYIWVPESGPPIGIIAGVIVGILALAAVIIGVVIWKKRQGGSDTSSYTAVYLS